MTKQEAIRLFKLPGSTRPQSDLADALGVTCQAIWHWPDELGEAHINKLISAAVLRGLSESTINKLKKLLTAMRGEK